MSAATTGACMVMGGCQLNVFTLELIVQREKNIGYFLTFLQFSFVALCGLFWVFDFRRWAWRPFQLPKREMIFLSFLFWFVSALNNAIFIFDISIPIHTTFRSSSLMISMLIGWLLLRKKYSFSQVLCVLAITVGIVVMTLEAKRRSDEERQTTTAFFHEPSEAEVAVPADMGNDIVRVSHAQSAALPPEGGEDLSSTSATPSTSTTNTTTIWHHPMIGIALLSIATVLGAVLGSMQEVMLTALRNKQKQQQQQKDSAQTRTTSGPSCASCDVAPPPQWAEMLFLSHAIAAPMFFLLPHRMAVEWAHVTQHPELTDLVVLMALNCITQFLCIIGVYKLVDSTSSFTVTLVLTLRKFFTLLFSIVYFQHFKRLRLWDCVGIGLVAAGSMLYSFAPKTSSSPPQVTSVSAKEQMSNDDRRVAAAAVGSQEMKKEKQKKGSGGGVAQQQQPRSTTSEGRAATIKKKKQ